MSEPVIPERKWKFGDFVRNRMAGGTNPLRDGIFVRRIIRTGRLNPGTCAEMTNGKGEFWETAEKNLDPTPGIVSAEAKVAELSSQILRLMAERDLLLGAIASEDYAKIKDQMVQVSESPDGVPRCVRTGRSERV